MDGSWSEVIVREADLNALLGWGAREKAIARLLMRGKLGYGEFLLRRQMNYDRLIAETGERSVRE